jgi:hypothetical protein
LIKAIDGWKLFSVPDDKWDIYGNLPVLKNLRRIAPFVGMDLDTATLFIDFAHSIVRLGKITSTTRRWYHS